MWGEAEVDLTNYAGNAQVYIRFRVQSNGSTNSDGWYIDDVSINETAVAIPYPFFEDFDGGSSAANWITSTWDIVGNGHSSPNKITEGDGRNYGPADGAYGNNNYDWGELWSVLTPAGTVDLSSAVNPRLTFWHRHSFYYASGSYNDEVDRGRVYISTDHGHGGTWVQLASYSQSQGDWAQKQLDLTAYRASTVRIMFVMDDNRDTHSYNSYHNRFGWGWDIDDVRIGEAGEMVDWCGLTEPGDVTILQGAETDTLYGLVYEQGVTEAVGEADSIFAEIGYGPEDQPPSTVAWQWFTPMYDADVDTSAGFFATYGVAIDSVERYKATLTVPTPGTYRFAYRFKVGVDGPWSYADLDGNTMGQGGLNGFVMGHAGVLRVIPNTVSLGGEIQYYAGDAGVDSALVALSGGAVGADTTDAAGVYGFADLPPDNYVVRPSKMGDIRGVVTPFDASHILRHAVGAMPLTPYQKIAADVTGNGQVGPFDASYILRYFVGAETQFPTGKDWMFVPTAFAITHANWPNAPDSSSYTPLNTNLPEEDYVGIVYGDVSGNWPGAPPAKMVDGGVLRTVAPDAFSASPGTEFTVPIRIDDAKDVLSAGLVVRYDPLTFEAVEAVPSGLASECAFAAHILRDGEIRIAMAGAAALEGSGALSEIRLRVREEIDPMTSSWLRIDEVVLNDGAIPAVGRSAVFSALPEEYALGPNAPNPFNPHTTIRYQLPRENEVTLRIYDMAGQLVRTLVERRVEVGYRTVLWDGRDERGREVASGVYLCRLQAGTFLAVQKMALIK